MSLLSYIILWIIIEASGVYGVNAECDGTAKNCSECLTSSPQCFWCSEHNFTETTFQRCASKQRLKDWNCDENHIISIESSKTIVKNSAFNQTMDSTVQLKPQRVTVRLRPNIPIQIPIQFQEAEDYPMDLYYLMDLSCTNIMKPHKTVLANVGKQIADKITYTTKNFRIGFGSFVDKPVIPFNFYNKRLTFDNKINTQLMNTNVNSISQCNGTVRDVEPPYSYKNRMSLNRNTTAFVESVSKSNISYNKDFPEGVLDALMQAMVCTDQIKWREQSHKIIVVATDDQFHYANDGKLGGILYPNDGKCHTTNDSDGIGIYRDWDVYDYPSLHHIAEKAREKKFFVVFSVDDKMRDVYQTLVDIIGKDNARVATLKANDNIVTGVIEDVYKSIRSSVSLRIVNKSDDINVELYSNCSKSVQYGNRSKCDNNFRRNQVISFEANITLLKCPKNKSQTKQSFQIGLTTVNENVTIEVEMLCECDCEKAGNAQLNSTECSNSGSFGCGICFGCNAGKTGRKCECDDNGIASTKDLKSLCRKEGDINICSEYGKCDNCGNCECDAQRSGRHCEFDDSTCFLNNIECTNNGKCIDGNCQCYPQFEGKFCECAVSDETCINRANTNVSQICSGNGECKCGSCQCNINWFGQYCDVCPKCESQQFCDHIIECVPQICGHLREAKSCGNSMCYLFTNYTLINQIDNISNTEISHNFLCFKTVNDCDNTFSYLRKDSDSKPFVYITPIKTVCPQKSSPVTISLSVIGSTILLGLAFILLWKLCTEIFDRKEFAKFQRELDKSQWSENTNPLFKDVSTTFKNPTFGLKDE